MSNPARPTRRYDATNRRARAAESQSRIIEAATEVFLERGYTASTIAAIAERAGVAIETIYRAAPGKAGLLAAAVQVALAGGVEGARRPVEQREGIRRVIDEPDPRRRLHAYAATQPGVWSRVGPLLRVLDEGARGDLDLSRLKQTHEAQRLEGMRRFARLLADQQSLRPDLDSDTAADILWALCAQSTFEDLVTNRGWTHHDFHVWLGNTLASALLP